MMLLDSCIALIITAHAVYPAKILSPVPCSIVFHAYRSRCHLVAKYLVGALAEFVTPARVRLDRLHSRSAAVRSSSHTIIAAVYRADAYTLKSFGV